MDFKAFDVEAFLHTFGNHSVNHVVYRVVNRLQKVLHAYDIENKVVSVGVLKPLDFGNKLLLFFLVFGFRHYDNLSASEFLINVLRTDCVFVIFCSEIVVIDVKLNYKRGNQKYNSDAYKQKFKFLRNFVNVFEFEIETLVFRFSRDFPERKYKTRLKKTYGKQT